MEKKINIGLMIFNVFIVGVLMFSKLNISILIPLFIVNVVINILLVISFDLKDDEIKYNNEILSINKSMIDNYEEQTNIYKKIYEDQKDIINIQRDLINSNTRLNTLNELLETSNNKLVKLYIDFTIDIINMCKDKKIINTTNIKTLIMDLHTECDKIYDENKISIEDYKNTTKVV